MLLELALELAWRDVQRRGDMTQLQFAISQPLRDQAAGANQRIVRARERQQLLLGQAIHQLAHGGAGRIRPSPCHDFGTIMR